MYKEAIVSLMLGKEFTAINEKVFTECFLPAKFEEHLWIKLKVAAYE